MKKRILVPYMAATLAMAASISVAARDGAVVARSYMNYNDQKPSVAAEYRYQTVGISWTNTYKIVTAEEARQKTPQYIIAKLTNIETDTSIMRKPESLR